MLMHSTERSDRSDIQTSGEPWSMPPIALADPPTERDVWDETGLLRDSDNV